MDVACIVVGVLMVIYGAMTRLLNYGIPPNVMRASKACIAVGGILLMWAIIANREVQKQIIVQYVPIEVRMNTAFFTWNDHIVELIGSQRLADPEKYHVQIQYYPSQWTYGMYVVGDWRATVVPKQTLEKDKS